MKGPAVTLTNGHYEFRIPTGGRLILADPPEAGWRRERSWKSDLRAQRERVRHRRIVGGPGEEEW